MRPYELEVEEASDGINRSGNSVTSTSNFVFDPVEDLAKNIWTLFQAIARDRLMQCMKELEGYRIVAHVHDEG